MAESPVVPMLAQPSTGASGRLKVDLWDLIRTGDWVLDDKLDGERAIWDGWTNRLFSRTGEDITRKFPEVITHLKGLGMDVDAVDGEIVADDGKFETTLTRGAQSSQRAINALAESMPCHFVAFDLPTKGQRTYDRTAYTWDERRALLEAMHDGYGLPITRVSYDDRLWLATKRAGGEGVIAKRRNGRYQPGKRSSTWVKFKHLHRVSCLIYGYTAGEHRDMGAIMLWMLDDANQPVAVGRCGAGFSDRALAMLHRRLDAGDLMVAEIEATHVTSGGTLRFPVYRGLRTDVDPFDCTVHQLDTLPRTSAPSVV